MKKEKVEKCRKVEPKVEVKKSKKQMTSKVEEKKAKKQSEKLPVPVKPRKEDTKNVKKNPKAIKKVPPKGKQRKISIQDNEPFKWGFTLQQVYRTAVKFYKEKEGRAFNLAYNVSINTVSCTTFTPFFRIRC